MAVAVKSTHVELYDQRVTKDEAANESKRRRVIRWIKTKISTLQNRHDTDSSDGGASDLLLLRNGFSSVSIAGSSTRQLLRRSSQYSTISGDHHFISSDHFTHVLIIGGGIGGLCLAQGLKKHGIPFTVFERDPTPNYRSQGYRLRINSVGYEALQANLFPEDFEVFLRSAGACQPGVKYLDAHTGTDALSADVPDEHLPTDATVFSADRAMLRSLLLTDLNEHEIQFGHAFKRYDVLPNGRVEVTFENGRIIEGSVVVGAEGTTSRVRRQYIPDAVALLDTDSGAIYGKTPVTPALAAFINTERTTMVRSRTSSSKLCLVLEPLCVTDVTKSDFAEVSASLSGFLDLEHYVCWVLFGRAELFHTRNDVGESQDLFLMSSREVAEIACEMTRHWAPPIRAVFESQASDWSSFLRISTTTPDLKRWEPSVVTLLGDAVHTMVPTGIGCNTALHDAHMLVQCFTEYGVGLKAIAAYEQTMRKYGSQCITASVAAGQHMFNLPSVEQMRVVVH